jgi:hypothetical protein
MSVAPPVPTASGPRVAVSAVTVWDGRESSRIDFAEGAPERGWREVARSLSAHSVLWVDMSLKADPTTWIDPWDSISGLTPDWSHVGRGASTVGLPFADPDTHSSNPVEVVLARLPRINELGELRWLNAQLARLGGSAQAMPLAGFRPTSTLDACHHIDALEFLLLRVNLAVVGRHVLTMRLPDRLCSGARRAEGRRIDAAAHCRELPAVADPERYVAPGDRPSAVDIGTAIGLYLSATCGCVAEYARRELTTIEHDALRLLDPNVSGDGEVSDTGALEPLTRQFRHIFETRGALQIADEELARLLQRQFDVDILQDDFRLSTRWRYQRALEDIRIVESELRLAGDALTHRLETLQVEQATQQEELARAREKDAVRRTETVQTLLAVLGTLLVIPTLIASMFQDQYKFPHPKSASALIGMVLIMVGGVGVVFFLLAVKKWVTVGFPRWFAWLTGPVVLAMVGVGVLLVYEAR